MEYKRTQLKQMNLRIIEIFMLYLFVFITCLCSCKPKDPSIGNGMLFSENFIKLYPQIYSELADSMFNRFALLEKLTQRDEAGNAMYDITDEDVCLLISEILSKDLNKLGYDQKAGICFMAGGSYYPYVKGKASLELGWVRKVPNAWPFVKVLLKDSDAGIRYCALACFSNCGTKFDIRDILPLLKDDASIVRSAAVTAILTVGGEEYVNYTTPLLKDSNYLVRGAVLHMFNVCNIAPIEIETVKSLLVDEDAIVRASAVSILCYWDDRDGIDGLDIELNRMLKDNDSIVKASVLNCMYRYDIHPNDVVLVKSLLEDQDEEVRSSAILVLAMWDINDTIDEALVLLNDQSDMVKASAVLTLGYMDASSYVELIRPFLLNSNELIRENAASAIGLIRGKDSENDLKLLLKDSVESVRFWAGISLIEIGSQNIIDKRIVSDMGAYYGKIFQVSNRRTNKRIVSAFTKIGLSEHELMILTKINK